MIAYSPPIYGSPVVEQSIRYPTVDGCIDIVARLNRGSGFPSPWLEPLEKKAIATIAQWRENAEGRICHYLSGGKDSLSVGHLIRQVDPDCPMAWINQGPLAEWPDCLLLLDELKREGWNIVELCPAFSLIHLYKLHGIPLESHMHTALDKTINDALIHRVAEEFEQLHNISGTAWGIRRESKGRTKFIHKCGTLHQRKSNNRWLCSPIGFWSTKQVWEYLDRHRLLYPAFYDRDRTTVRNGPPIGTTGVNRGRLIDIRHYYPELWVEFCKIFPEIKDYAG